MRSNWKLVGSVATAVCLFGCFVAANNARLQEQPIDPVGQECTVTLSPPGTQIVGTVLSATESFIQVKGNSPKDAQGSIYYVLPVHSIVQIKFVHVPGKAE